MFKIHLILWRSRPKWYLFVMPSVLNVSEVPWYGDKILLYKAAHQLCLFACAYADKNLLL